MKQTKNINSDVRRMLLPIILLAAVLPISASDGDQFSCGGLWFEVLSESQKAAAVIAPRDNQYTSEGIVIPETIKHPQTASLYTVTEIGTYAFHSCSELVSVTIPNSVTAIGNYAFYGCSKLASVSIPNSITTIGNYAFCDCSKLVSVTIPNSVTTIGIKAFWGCSALKSVVLGSSVNETAMSNSCLLYCSKLVARLDVSKDNPYICSANDAVYSKDKTMLYRLAPGRKDTSFTVPNSVTAVVSNAFEGCSDINDNRDDQCL